MAKLSTSLKKVEKIIPNNVADKLRKKKKITNEAVVPPIKKKPDLKETFDEKRAKFDEEFEALEKSTDFINKRKAKFDAYEKKKGADALDEFEYNKKYNQLYKNPEIGKIGEQVFEEFMGGYISPKKAIQTSGGKRYFDNVKDGTAREIKTGTKTSPETIKNQMMKDAEIIDLNLSSHVTKIEWHFLDSYDQKVINDILKEVYKEYPSVQGKFNVKFY